MSKRLCVCVDDVGLHAGINAAALALVGLGRVHALACQVGGPAWTDAAEQLRRLEGVDVGLHLDLTQHPLLYRPRPLEHVIARSLLRRFDTAALRAEVAAQLDHFERGVGRPPDFIDGHQHVHQLPQVREAMLAELRHRGMSRPWLRNTRRRRLPRWQFKPWLIERLGAAALARQAQAAGFGQNRALLGVYDFAAAGPSYGALLQRWLAVAGDGDLLMCHPSMWVPVDSDGILAARVAEFGVLSGVGFDAQVREHGLMLAPLSWAMPR